MMRRWINSMAMVGALVASCNSSLAADDGAQSSAKAESGDRMAATDPSPSMSRATDGSRSAARLSEQSDADNRSAVDRQQTKNSKAVKSRRRGFVDLSVETAKTSEGGRNEKRESAETPISSHASDTGVCDFAIDPACFKAEWFRCHPDAWVASDVAENAWWTAPAWKEARGWCGIEDDPATYDYGNNITYDGKMIYYDRQPAAGAKEYYEQALELTASFQQNLQNEGWLPLGVFAVLGQGQTKPDHILQIALNKQGAVRGNLVDRWTGKVAPVAGAVDKSSQRVAFRTQGQEAAVAECGLWNLTNNSTPLMIHFGPQCAELRNLTRLTREPSQEPAKKTP